MSGGVMDGKVYSFSFDAAWQSGTWVEYGVALELHHHDDLKRIAAIANIRVLGWLEHDHINFSFSPATLKMNATLMRTPSSDDLLQCKQARPGHAVPAYCVFDFIEVASSDGTCEAVARPEIIVNTTPVAKPAPSVMALPKDCDSVEIQVGNERRCLKSKDSFKDCPDCPEMVVIPTGEFIMGSPPDEAERGGGEGPQHKVRVAQPFAAGKFEVTFAEWDACVSGGGCKHKPDDEGWGRGKRPVINVSWDDATKEYLPWLRRKTSKTYRLLSEAEWEYAARAGTTTVYSTGNSITRSQAQFSETLGTGKQTVEVGKFAPNPWGPHDMHGNVWEWVADCYKDSYTNAPSDGKAASDVAGCSRVARGGSWIMDRGGIRVAYRGRTTSGFRIFDVGFRLARTISP